MCVCVCVCVCVERERGREEVYIYVVVVSENKFTQDHSYSSPYVSIIKKENTG